MRVAFNACRRQETHSSGQTKYYSLKRRKKRKEIKNKERKEKKKKLKPILLLFRVKKMLKINSQVYFRPERY